MIRRHCHLATFAAMTNDDLSLTHSPQDTRWHSPPGRSRSWSQLTRDLDAAGSMGCSRVWPRCRWQSRRRECSLVATSGRVPLLHRLTAQILYSLPVGEGVMEDLNAAQEKAGDKCCIRVMVDHPLQIAALQRSHKRLSRRNPWSVFVKVDGGGKRAGAPPRSAQMKALIEEIAKTPEVEIFGFYSRAYHYYRLGFVRLSCVLTHLQTLASRTSRAPSTRQESSTRARSSASTTPRPLRAPSACLVTGFCLSGRHRLHTLLSLVQGARTRLVQP